MHLNREPTIISLSIHVLDASTVLAKQIKLDPLSTLIAIEYYEQLGPLLPANSISPSLQTPAYLDNQIERSSSISKHIPIYVPTTLPSELNSFLLEYPQEIEELKIHLKQSAEIEFDCWKTNQNELGIVKYFKS